MLRCRACQTVMAAILGGMLSALAPMAPHLAEDAWQNLPYPAPAQSVFQVRLPHLCFGTHNRTGRPTSHPCHSALA